MPADGAASAGVAEPDAARIGVAGHVRRTLRWVRVRLSYRPVFLPVVIQFTPRGWDRRITAGTQLVVEGFPRSSNTFAAAAIRVATDDRLVVASHVHTPSQVMAAVRRDVPVLFVVRRPHDCIRSAMVASPHVRLTAFLEEWIAHHETVWPLRDRLVVATFDQVTGDMNGVIRRLHESFGIDVPAVLDDPQVVECVRARMRADHDRWHPGDQKSSPWPEDGRSLPPSVERALADPRHAARFAVADEWFRRFSRLANGDDG